MSEAGWAALAAILSTTTAYMVARWQRPKIRAETETEQNTAAERLSMMSLKLVEPLDARISELETELGRLRATIATLRAEVTDLEKGIHVLRGQIFQLGATPIWPPKNGEA